MRCTAILELKTFAMIMGEVVRLGYAEANPLVSIKLRWDKAKKKPELTDREIADIGAAHFWIELNAIAKIFLCVAVFYVIIRQ
jgi:hypothetical protein